MLVDITIYVYEYAPHGHGTSCDIDDYIDVSEETYLKIKEYCDEGQDELDYMNIPELEEILDGIKEEHIDFARDRLLISGGDEEDFEEPEITIKVAEGFFDEGGLS